MHSLLKLLVVDDSSNFALAIGGPIGRGYLDSRIANINAKKTQNV